MLNKYTNILLKMNTKTTVSLDNPYGTNLKKIYHGKKYEKIPLLPIVYQRTTIFYISYSTL